MDWKEEGDTERNKIKQNKKRDEGNPTNNK